MSSRFTAFQKLDAEVRHARGANLPLFNQPRHRVPGVLDRNASFIGPMELKEIDSLDAEPSKRCLALTPDRIRMKRASRHLHAVLRIPLETALGEDVRPVGRWKRSQEVADDFFGMSEPVDRSGVDPVHPAVDGVTHGRNRRPIVLRTPRERPSATAGGPGAESNGRESHTAGAERPLRKYHLRIISSSTREVTV